MAEKTPDAWSYEWYGDADEGPTRWHKTLSFDHPTEHLPVSYHKNYRNIRPLIYSDEAYYEGVSR